MRVFYAFKINSFFYDMYNNNPYKLYKMLQEIHYMNDYDINDVKEKLKQIVNRINKQEINKNIIDKLYTYNDYFNKENTHIICDNHEYTKLIVEDYLIKIKSNQKYPLILETLTDENIFVCDFINREYFFVDLEKSIA